MQDDTELESRKLEYLAELDALKAERPWVIVHREDWREMLAVRAVKPIEETIAQVATNARDDLDRG